MILTIAGDPGSGKTTVAKKVAAQLGYNRYSGGDMRSTVAQERGMTIDELNDLGMKEDWTDKETDKKVEELG